MPELAKETVALLSFLLPGFIVAWAIYGLTSYPKPSQFERVIQALIFTLIVRAVVFLEQGFLEWIGRCCFVLRPWDAAAELFTSLGSAVLVSLGFVCAINKDALHRVLRRVGVSSRDAYPSEWVTAFTACPRYVVLHLTDGRRLYGWPRVWPSDPRQGHFLVKFAAWIQESDPVELAGVEGVLIAARLVHHVEFMEVPRNGD